MKNGLHNNFLIFMLFIFILSTLTMVGYGFWEDIPVLINAGDGAFIDIYESTSMAISNSDDAYSQNQPTPIITPTPTAKPTPVPTQKIINKSEKKANKPDNEIKIEVKDQTILIDNKRCNSLEELRDVINSNRSTNFTILDDYAEYHTFQSVLNIFDELDINPEVHTN